MFQCCIARQSTVHCVLWLHGKYSNTSCNCKLYCPTMQSNESLWNINKTTARASCNSTHSQATHSRLLVLVQATTHAQCAMSYPVCKTIVVATQVSRIINVNLSQVLIDLTEQPDTSAPVNTSQTDSNRQTDIQTDSRQHYLPLRACCSVSGVVSAVPWNAEIPFRGQRPVQNEGPDSDQQQCLQHALHSSHHWTAQFTSCSLGHKKLLPILSYL